MLSGNVFDKKLSVGLILFFSGSIDLMFSNPIILITSSTKSISANISGLHVGTLTIKFFPFFFSVKPNLVKILYIWFDLTFIPTILLTKFGTTDKSSKKDNTKKSIQLLRGDLKEINDLGDEKIEIKNQKNAGYYIETIGKDI